MKTRRFRRCLPLLAAMVIGNAWAVDNESLFELDYNGPDAADTADNGFGNDGDDWNNLYFDTDSAIQTTFSPTGLSGALEEGGPILLDLTALQGADTVFTSGGSKDDNFIGSWKWKYAGPPDKNDIEHAFAAAYVNDDGELIIYMGADRFETNGDAQMGFWFLQDPEFGPVEGDPGGSGLGFNGEHVNGDILVQANFVNGGKVPVIQVYEWAEGLGDDGNTNLRRLGVTNGSFTQFGECDGSGDDACGLTNSDFITSAWPYISKDGDTDIPPQALFEVGINLTALLAEANGGEVPNLCFSAFVAETRASASFTAVLKDWVYGSFELCGIDVTKTCRDLNGDENGQGTISEDGSTITLGYEGTVTNTGAVGYTVDLEDLVNGNGGTTGGDGITQVCIDGLDGNPKDGICQEGENLGASVINEDGTATFDLGGGQVALYQGEWTVTGSVSSLSFKDEISATARVGETPLFDEPSSAEATCMVVGSPAIAVTKSCTNANIENETTFVADISGTVENTGNVKLVNVTFSDVVTGAPLTGDYTVLRADLSAFPTDGSGELAPGEVITFTGDVASTTFTSHANTITWSGTNVFDSNDDVSAYATAPGNGEVCEFNATPSINVIKNCAEDGVDLKVIDGLLAIVVNTSLTVTNNGFDEKLKQVKLTDPEGGLVSSDGKFECNEAGTECTAKAVLSVNESADFTQQYRPDTVGTDIIGTLTDPTTISFHNEASVEGVGVLSQGPVSDDDFTDCPLCECEDCSEEP